MRILHVTEALCSGIATVLSQVAKAQALRSGVEVVIAHSLRPESPTAEELHRLFPHPIRRIVVPMVTAISPREDLASVRRILALYKSQRPDVIHLHSSKAGVLGRFAAIFFPGKQKVFYSPHGLAFLRQDVSRVKRWTYLALENMAATFGGVVVASSKSEYEIIRSRIPAASCALVVNGIDLEGTRMRGQSQNEEVAVVTSGRITFAKAPWRFKELAMAMEGESAFFRWIGDGELRDHLKVGNQYPQNLSVKGWSTDGSAVLDELARSDIFVLASLWEGMPISLIEAQAAGIPAVVSDVAGCRDVVIHNETGFVCRSDSEMVNHLRTLIRDSALRQQMGAAASRRAFERFSIDRMEEDLSRIYRA